MENDQFSFSAVGSSVLGQAPSGECRFLLDDD
ncbi:MAG: hypothetical protein ACJAWS_000685 [Oleiphilaceae bacterium]|jgi:hypothetical protein